MQPVGESGAMDHCQRVFAIALTNLVKLFIKRKAK